MMPPHPRFGHSRAGLDPLPRRGEDVNLRTHFNVRRLVPISLVLLSSLTAFGLGCGWYVSNPVYSEDAMNKPNNFSNGRFTNAEPTTVMKPGSNWDTIYQYLFKGHRDRTPRHLLPVV